MKTFKSRLAAATLAVLCLAVTTSADIRLPDQPNGGGNRRVQRPASSRTFNMSIRSSDTQAEARLVIPAEAVRQLRAELEGEAPSFAASLGLGGLPPAHTAAAGLLLSLALVTGGLWLARAGRSARARRVAAVVGVCALCALSAGAAATLTLANIAPPSLPLDAGTLPRAVGVEPLSGTVRVVLSKEGSGGDIMLVVPKAKTEAR